MQSAVGFELWSMSKDIFFDNVIITDDLAVADHWAAATFDKKRQKIAKDSVSIFFNASLISNLQNVVKKNIFKSEIGYVVGSHHEKTELQASTMVFVFRLLRHTDRFLHMVSLRLRRGGILFCTPVESSVYNAPVTA